MLTSDSPASRAASARPSAVPTALVAVAGLAGGFALARYTHRRELGGLAFAVAGAWCAREWSRTSGPGVAAALTGLYVAAMGGSHPLAKKLGPWPSVGAVSAAVAGAAGYADLKARRG